MPRQIETAFVQQYRDTVLNMLSQQKNSRLMDTVYVERGVKGEAYYFDQIGTTSGQQVATTGGDSPENTVAHARRRVDPVDWDWGKLIEQPDKLRMLIDPTSGYLMAARAARNRFIDDLIIAAGFGTAKTGKDGSTLETSGWTVVAVNSHTYDHQTETASGNVGMTVGKLIEAKLAMGAAEADEYDDEGQPLITVACSAKQIANMLRLTAVTSSDYNGVKALVEGKTDTFMGCRFKRTQRMLLNGSNYERVMMYHKMGIGLAVWEEVTTELAPRPDKKFMPYAYMKQTMQATRLEKEKVVEILCV